MFIFSIEQCICPCSLLKLSLLGTDILLSFTVMDKTVHILRVTGCLFIWITSDTVLHILSPEVSPLQPLPAFASGKEKNALDNHYSPFPGYAFVLEDDMVYHGNVERRENSNETSHDGPKEERVLSTIIPPLIEDVVPPVIPARVHRLGDLAEERSPEVDHLPCQE